MVGRIFDIQRFSVHDGPGIRTTVFMKGCPLRCRWCHNPEGLTALPQLRFSAEKCIGCGSCGDRSRLSDAEHCPAEALTVCGREVTADEVMSEVLKDVIFYSDGGGLTVSGGECLLQSDFVTELLALAKAHGLHTAIDTSGYAPWSELEKTLSLCDLYLYDVKCFDPLLHKEYTGVDNTIIIENLRRLAAEGKDIWIRIPIIPDFNDNARELEAIADLLSGLSSVKQVTLMPYHSLGASKYETLGMTYGFDTSKQISEGAILGFGEIFKSRGLTLA